MTHPGIFAIIVGVAIGTAIYYYFNSEGQHRAQQYRSGESHNGYYDYDRNSNNFTDTSRPRKSCRSDVRRRRNSNECCTVCLEAVGGEDCRRLDNCGHEFHINCITKWLREKNECPLCRAPA